MLKNAANGTGSESIIVCKWLLERYVCALCMVGCVYMTEVVEHCCSITTAILGETLPNIARDMDTYSYRLPIGVTAGITPFNFPAMIPMWVSRGRLLALLQTLSLRFNGHFPGEPRLAGVY